MGRIVCHCGFNVFDGLLLRIRFGQFSNGYMNLKCPKCKVFLNGIDIKHLTGELRDSIDFRTVKISIKEVKHDG